MKKILSLLLAMTLAFSLAACGTGGGSSDGGEGGGSGSSEGGHKLTVYAWDPAFNIPAIEAAAADYKENVDSEFELEILEQAGSEDVETAITTAGSSGDYVLLEVSFTAGNPWVVISLEHNGEGFAWWDDVAVSME